MPAILFHHPSLCLASVLRRRLPLLCALAALWAAEARALCPHEVLVLANGESIDSVLVARTYMGLYGIPEENLVRLDIPEGAFDETGGISPNGFTEWIWRPAVREVEERGLSGRILVWAYSCDFPFRVTTKPEMSITGVTFLRNRLPEPMTAVQKGTYVSPLFAGPRSRSRADDVPQSSTFDRLHATLMDDMPLPAMMLGWTGLRGNTVDEVIEALERGRESDGTMPGASYLFETNSNVRATTRAWEFPAIVGELGKLGVRAEIRGRFPVSGPAAGIMAGRETLPASKVEFAPGAYADHLTSSAASYQIAHQTKVSEWFRRGATASSGTVTEPQAYWQKFPGASLFLHQRRGCSMIEAIYLATACPLQLLPVGDPLASPCAVRPEPRIAGAEAVGSGGDVELRAECAGATRMRFDWLVDGRYAGRGAELRISLPPGVHRVRLVARGRDDVRVPGEAELRLEVPAPSAP